MRAQAFTPAESNTIPKIPLFRQVPFTGPFGMAGEGRCQENTRAKRPITG